MKGYSYGEVLDDQCYALWVVNTESDNSHPDLMRLATFLRANGVYPTGERSGMADAHSCVSSVERPVSKSPTMPTASKPKPEEPEPQKVKEPDAKTAHSRVSRARQQTTCKRWDGVVADGSQSREVVQMRATMTQLNQGMMNLDARVTKVEQNDGRGGVECYVMTDGESIMTDGESSSTESRRAF